MLGFIVALIAGFVTPYIEEPVARPVAQALSGAIKLESGEMRAFAFMLMALAAGLLATLLASGSAFWIAAGTVLGYFATRIVAAAKAAVDGRPRS
ncbi:MAG: hypothetical protein GC146_14625 [Limimaricola sp.]|uniref:hypothetical protein n=1 Tax=Limimaricola sp. TaxID=2211665 RepID=UPI001E17BAFF|nr:hypothetical protein [Limimaricola sp.]MBI1418449.1 hypothetical protein [Limimaricola sp.]